MRIFLLLLLLTSAVHAQYAPSASVPTLSFFNSIIRAQHTYPDGRLWVPAGSTSDPTTIHVPVYVRNCWRTTKPDAAFPVVGFPITSFSIPIQFDSSFFEVIGIDTTGHASNFSYSWYLSSDTTYMTIVNDRQRVQQRGMRITINGTAVSEQDTLNLTGPYAQEHCDLFPFTRMFSLILRVKPRSPLDTNFIPTALVISNDSLRYQGLRVFDSVWQTPRHRWTGLEGIDNFYFDAGGIEQCRDLLRPSRSGMLWIEFTEATPSIVFKNFNGSQAIDTVTIRIPRTHTWADSISGQGVADVWVSNGTERSRATNIHVSTQEPWMRFRSISTGQSVAPEPIPAPVRTGVFPYLDRGLLGEADVFTLMWEPTQAQPPQRLRIFASNTMSATRGRYVGAITFTSTTMRPERVDLPVVLIISDTTTSVMDQGASGSLSNGSITIAPNPSSGAVSISATSDHRASLDIVAMDGRIIERFSLDAGSSIVIPGTLTAGSYRVVLRSPAGITSAGFIVTP